MKTLRNILIIMLSVGLIMSCSKPDTLSENNSNVLKKNKAEPKTVTVPFKADFVGDYVGFYFLGDEEFECDPIYNCLVLVDFTGTASHLGEMYGNFKFCACGPDDPELDGPDSQYAPSESYFVASNGDTLFVSCWGSVREGRLPDHPEYVVSFWRVPFVILGGTGRFEGATGGGMTDDYNSSLDPNSHHHWTGTITMVKGKR